jgi:HAD superfamily hydrolase (TIGR01509 family)
MTSPTTPRTILFDFDGTLVDSEPLHYSCWLEAIRPWGGSTDWPDYQRRFVGITDRQAGKIFLSECGQDPTDELVRTACDTKHRLYRARCGEQLAIPDDAVILIQELALIVQLAVVSSSIAMELGPVLEKAGLSDTVPVVVCGDHVTRHKPDPEPYQLAAMQLKEKDILVDPSNCLVFEDSAAGMASATAAGMRVCQVRHPSGLADQLRGEVSALLDLAPDGV